MITLKYVVTFRTESKSPQQELIRWTKPAAENFAQGIIDMGGVAIVTEEAVDIPEHTADEIRNPQHGTLDWAES